MTHASVLRGLLAACLLASAWQPRASAQAQAAAVPTPAPGSGDAWVDATLADIDRYAARYPDAFTDELVRYDSAPRALVVALLADPQWTPGDVYFACALGQVAGQPCRAVAQRWQHDRASGWAAIARGFGVAPDSDAFHRLKRGIVLAYRRWARPLRIDASLHAEFPKLPLAATVAATVDKGVASARASRRKASAAPASTPARADKDAAKAADGRP
jgi:hypothetical protein